MRILPCVAAVLAAQLMGCAAARPLPPLSAGNEFGQLTVRIDCSGFASYTFVPVFCDLLAGDLQRLGADLVREGGEMVVKVARGGPSDDGFVLDVDVRTDRLLPRVSFNSGKDCGAGDWDSVPHGVMPCFARKLANQLAQSRAVAELTTRRLEKPRPPPIASMLLPATQPPARTSAAIAGKLAVLDLRNFTADLTKQNAQYFTDVVRHETLRSQPQLDVMTRENLLVLIQATGKKIDDCEGECEVDTGRRIGADLIISGEIQTVGTHYKISLRLHETKEGRLLGSAIASGSSVDELDEHTALAAAELYATAR